MNYIPNYTGFKAINEKTNFILGPTPGGDPHKEYGKPFFIEVDSKNKRSVDKKIKSISLGKGAGPTNKNLRVYWTKGKFGDVARIEASTPGALQDLLDVLDNKKDGIQSMGWVDLEESIKKENMKKLTKLFNEVAIDMPINKWERTAVAFEEGPMIVGSHKGKYYIATGITEPGSMDKIIDVIDVEPVSKSDYDFIQKKQM